MTTSIRLPQAVEPTLRYERVLAHVLAVSLAIGAGVHAGLVPAHLEEGGPRLAAAFVLCTVAMAVLAVLTRRRDNDSWAALVAAIVLTAAAVAYVLSRTTGIPLLVGEPEALDALGIATSSVEVVGALAGAVLFTNARREQS